MANSNKVNALAEALRIMLLEEAKDADLDLSARQLQLILSLPDDTFDMSKAKRQQMIDKLFGLASEPSLGELIKDAMKRANVTESNLVKASRVPASVLKKLRSDALMPNNVPVLLLRNLLNQLQLSVDVVERAIFKTFEMVRNTELEQLKASPVRAWARRPGEEKGNVVMNKAADPAARELYENKASLTKYVAQLKELMTKEED